VGPPLGQRCEPSNVRVRKLLGLEKGPGLLRPALSLNLCSTGEFVRPLAVLVECLAARRCSLLDGRIADEDIVHVLVGVQRDLGVAARGNAITSVGDALV
jgi:hypothetical protein